MVGIVEKLINFYITIKMYVYLNKKKFGLVLPFQKIVIIIIKRN